MCDRMCAIRETQGALTDANCMAFLIFSFVEKLQKRLLGKVMKVSDMREEV